MLPTSLRLIASTDCYIYHITDSLAQNHQLLWTFLQNIDSLLQCSVLYLVSLTLTIPTFSLLSLGSWPHVSQMLLRLLQMSSLKLFCPNGQCIGPTCAVMAKLLSSEKLQSLWQGIFKSIQEICSSQGTQNWFSILLVHLFLIKININLVAYIILQFWSSKVPDRQHWTKVKILEVLHFSWKLQRKSISLTFQRLETICIP